MHLLAWTFVVQAGRVVFEVALQRSIRYKTDSAWAGSVQPAYDGTKQRTGATFWPESSMPAKSYVCDPRVGYRALGSESGTGHT
jgi:hypothetical protein